MLRDAHPLKVCREPEERPEPPELAEREECAGPEAHRHLQRVPASEGARGLRFHLPWQFLLSERLAVRLFAPGLARRLQKAQFLAL